MTEFEQKLIKAVARTIKEDNISLEALTDKVMAQVRAYCDKHKKGYKALNDVEKQMLNNANYILRKISRYKYTEKQLNKAIENNLKRVPGNLADEDRREDLYNVLANLNFKCIYSNTLLVGGGQKIHLDHIIPVNLGGPTDDWNILPICGSCNSSKSDSHLLDWWEKEHTAQDEHTLVYIFEHMANRLLKSLNTKGVKVVTTLTDEQIARAIELENKEKQKQESKAKELDIEDDFYDNFDEDIEEVEEIKDEKIKRLDAITFLYQMLNHIKQNRQYIISQENLNQGVLDTPSEKDKQRLIDKKWKKLEKLFNQLYKQNKKLTGVKTDIQLLDEQRKMVEYIKSLDIVSYYHISYTYFDELQQMLNEGKTDKEIQEFCNSVDRAFNFNQFYNELMAYKEEFGDLLVPYSHINKKTGYRLGQTVNNIRHGKKTLDYWNILSEEEKAKTKRPMSRVLTEEQYKMLDAMGFVWKVNRSFDYDKFYDELMIYKEKFGNLEVPAVYVNEKTGYKLGQVVSNIRVGKKALDDWNELSEKEKTKTKKPTGVFLTDNKYQQLEDEGFVWDAKSFDYEEFYNELMEYKAESGDLLVPKSYINEKTGYKLGQVVSNIRLGKKALDDWNELSEEEKGETKKPYGYFLTEDKYQQLTDEGFVWDAKSFDYEEFYNELMVYKEKFGDLLVPTVYINEKTGYKLGQTINNIRTGKKALDEWDALREEEKLKAEKPRGTFLTENKYQQLTENGFIWEIDRSFDYEEFHNELMVYKKEYGDLLVPQSYVNEKTGYKLGQSVSCIRQGKKALDEWNELSEEEKKNTKKPANMVLSDEEYQQLEAEGFVWDATITFDYNKFYKELMVYKEEFGDLLVPQDYVNKKTGYKLGKTVSRIRTGKKNLKEYQAWINLSKEEKKKFKRPAGIFLTEDRYKQLTKDGFIWEVRKKNKVVTEQGLSA